MKNNILLHYESVSAFKKKFFNNLLTTEHLQGGEVMIDKLVLPTGDKEEEVNFWGYILEKDNNRYLLPSRDKEKNFLDVKDLLPCIAEDLEKVAYQGKSYQIINKPIRARFRPVKTMSFKELVDVISDLEHTNPEHRKLMVLMGFTQMMDRANFRISTPPAFGKDSIVDTMGSLFGNASTIENPTIAKLEFMTTFKWLAINEVIDISKSEWRNIEQFLLATGAHKPEISKRSRSYKNLSEILNISQFSLTLMYNDITDYKTTEDYIDFVTKRAVLDRFPPFRFHGVFQEDFNKIKEVNVTKFVEENFDYYKSMIYAFTYYKENFLGELHGYNIIGLNKLPQRWNYNVGKLLRVIDLYCDSQEEFNKFIILINGCIADYKSMLMYPNLIEQVHNKGKTPTLVNNFDTFLSKNQYLNSLLVNKESVMVTRKYQLKL